MKNVPFIVKIAFKPVLILILLVIFSFVGFSKAFGEIGNLSRELEKVRKTENILKSKLNILSESDESINTNYAVSFLPGENTSLSALYQLRSNAFQNGLIITNFRVGSETKESSDFMKVAISFDIEGPLPQILNFINLTKMFSPNIWIEKTELEFAGEAIRAKVYTKSYWAPFPTKIPALTDPITELSAKDKEILSTVIDYLQPPFASITPGIPGENINPFGE